MPAIALSRSEILLGEIRQVMSLGSIRASFYIQRSAVVGKLLLRVTTNRVRGRVVTNCTQGVMIVVFRKFVIFEVLRACHAILPAARADLDRVPRTAE
jgi:hypothetical protein